MQDALAPMHKLLTQWFKSRQLSVYKVPSVLQYNNLDAEDKGSWCKTHDSHGFDSSYWYQEVEKLKKGI